MTAMKRGKINKKRKKSQACNKLKNPSLNKMKKATAMTKISQNNRKMINTIPTDNKDTNLDLNTYNMLEKTEN